MKNLSKNGLSDLQFMALVFTAMVGATVIYLPRDMAAGAGRDGWMTILAAGLAVFLVANFVFLLCRRFPQKTLAEFSCTILGKPLGIVVSLLYALYAVFVAGIKLRIFVEVSRTWVMFWTPITFFIALFLLSALYIILQGAVPLGRLSELILFITLFSALLMFLPMAQFNFIHLKPVGQEGLLTIARAAPRASFAYLGFETLLVLFPLVQSRGKVYRLYTMAISLAGILFAGTALMVYGVSGVEHTRLQIWPVMEYLATGRLLFIERIDNLFLFVMTFKVVGLVAVQYYAAAVTMAHITNKKLYALWVLVLLPVLFAVAFLPAHQYQVFQLAAFLGPAGFTFIFSLVLLLLVVAIIRGKDDRKEEAGQ